LGGGVIKTVVAKTLAARQCILSAAKNRHPRKFTKVYETIAIPSLPPWISAWSKEASLSPPKTFFV